jgi:hypothetical protein
MCFSTLNRNGASIRTVPIKIRVAVDITSTLDRASTSAPYKRIYCAINKTNEQNSFGETSMSLVFTQAIYALKIGLSQKYLGNMERLVFGGADIAVRKTTSVDKDGY